MTFVPYFVHQRDRPPRYSALTRCTFNAPNGRSDARSLEEGEERGKNKEKEDEDEIDAIEVDDVDADARAHSGAKWDEVEWDGTEGMRKCILYHYMEELHELGFNDMVRPHSLLFTHQFLLVRTLGCKDAYTLPELTPIASSARHEMSSVQAWRVPSKV